jgi:prefoldin subunit 5
MDIARFRLTELQSEKSKVDSKVSQLDHEIKEYTKLLNEFQKTTQKLSLERTQNEKRVCILQILFTFSYTYMYVCRKKHCKIPSRKLIHGFN